MIPTDWSANKPTLPNIGTAFAASGPYASYVLLATVPFNNARKLIEIENNSGAQIAIIRDPGDAVSGALPATATIFALGGGSGTGSQGGSWASSTFRGRVQVYGPAAGTAQVAVMED